MIHRRALHHTAPQAPKLCGQLFGDFAAAGRLSIGALGNAILSVEPMEEEGDPPLVETENGMPVILNLLGRCAAAVWLCCCGVEGGVLCRCC